MKTITAAFIVFGFLVPVLAEARSSSRDTNPPVISSVSDIKVESPNGLPKAVTYTKPTAKDAKDGTVAVTCTPASGSTFALGATTVVCSAKDAAGNKATKSFKVVVKDSTEPSITSLHIQSSNTNPSIAVPGDVVSLSFTTNEKIQTPVVLVNAKPLFLRALNSSGNNWVATYTVGTKNPLGKVAWAIAMADTADNIYACSSPRIFILSYCPTTDGSSVTITSAATTSPADTTPPVIEAHADVSVATINPAGTTVTYTLPAATDNLDGAVAVSCAPASGSIFAVGTTTVNCSAQDAAGNTAASSFAVGVSLTVVAPPEDVTAPVISAHADVVATTTETSAEVSYDLPTATDDTDGAVAVSCAPASGSTFELGETTVECSASDAAGNEATSSFLVVVEQELPPSPEPYTMKAQSNESYLCGEVNNSWRYCDAEGTFSFTDAIGSGVATINLGLGSILGDGTLESVTIANTPLSNNHPWLISFNCFTDSNYTDACTDWDSISQSATEGTDTVHWTAEFAGSITFVPEYYYQLVIDDTGWEAPAYGSASLQEPYYVITGLH